MKDTRIIYTDTSRTVFPSIRLNSYIILLLYSITITAISYISINTSSQIYDYPFHMARIVGLAQSISNGDILPNLNFLFTHGSGYGVPMFYGNFILYIPALVFLITKTGTIAFTSYAFIIIIGTTWSSYYSLYKITENRNKSILFGMTMSTILPYFGFGMTAVLPLIPFLVYCIYKVLYAEKLNPIPLGITIALLVQTHIISTLVLGISSAIFILFLINKLSIKKMISFAMSVIIALLLSIGFIIQYVEQQNSQTFFVSWGLRDYPFPSVDILVADNFLNVLKNYYFPLSLLFLVIGLLLFKFLSQVPRALLSTSVVLLVAASDILPWQSVLRFTFFTVFQYPTRLIYFLPAFIIMALFIVDVRYLKSVIAVTQILFYIVTNPLTFLPNSSPYLAKYGLSATNSEVMRIQNSQATNAYANPYDMIYWSSGGEYFNLSINYDQVKDGTINKFIYDTTCVAIENIKQSYNSLEFDFIILNNSESANITLPRIWYKGYTAIYSNGAEGSQPEIEYVKLSEDELQQYKEAHKPNVTRKALNNGQSMITVTSSGRVEIRYKKTFSQIVGFVLETIAWLSLLLYIGISLKGQMKK